MGSTTWRGPLYVGPLAPELAGAGPWAMPWIAWRLRLPDGCPWDREQTHASLRKHLLEEAYEVYDALAEGATPALAGELGDLLLQVILHAQLAAEAGSFDLADVQANLTTKIVRRHPHVFGTAEAHTAADVNRQWERIKAAERAEAVDSSGGSGDGSAHPGSVAGAGSDARPAPKSALEGISRSMPALAASQEMQERAAALGYDWPTIEGILAKLHEELAELLAAGSDAEREEELGDLLMVAVNLGRRQGIEAEAALRRANDKFRRRFASVERQAHDQGVALRDLDFERPRRALEAGQDRGARSGRKAGDGPGSGDRRAPGDRPAPGDAQMTIGNPPATIRADGRGPTDLRPITLTLDVLKWAEGSCRIRVGDTEVLCAASIEDRVPPHLRGKGTGWVTAEYSMLPRATAERSQRESAKGRIGGRTHEIQRLVGRSLRGVVDLARLGERTVTIDCDVLQADGGTRTASITGGYVALAAALIGYGMERTIQGKVAAVSVGIVGEQAYLDLDYSEDSRAEVDFNVVGTDAGAYVELQGTAEGKPFDRAHLNELLDLAGSGLERIFAAQAEALAGVHR